MKKLITTPPYLKQYARKNFNSAEYYFDSDPASGKVGSGGGTVNLLYNAFKAEKNTSDIETWLAKEKRLIIHAGGQSKRLPAYAAVGKILTSIPVLKWERGQHIDQTLLDLLLPLYEKILKKAPEKFTTLIGNGDVLIRNNAPLPDIPEADVICFALWEQPAKASRHGVFFSDKKQPEKLAFVLQKPSIDQIQSLQQDYFFLIDIGLWLLSARAVKILFQKSGWNGKNFEHDRPDFYDLFTTFGQAMGHDPVLKDKDINALSVAVVPLPEGEFYHFGTSAELVESTSRLQALEKNPQKIWHNKVKPNPDLYTQNAICKYQFEASDTCIWIENSWIGAHWQLTDHHVITGIPQNDWHIALPAMTSLDIIPIGTEDVYAIRVYSYFDPQRPVRGLMADTNKAATDWYSEKAYPVFHQKDLSADKIQYFIDNPYDIRHFAEATTFISAEDIAEKVCLERQFAQRKTYLKQNLAAIADNWQKSVFHQLDLKHTAKIFQQENIPLPASLPKDSPLFAQMQDQMFRSQVLTYRDTPAKEIEKYTANAFGLLRQTIIATAAQHPVNPALNVLSDQIIWGRSPVRLDIAGGWTDTPPFCMINGGNVVNLAVELNGQPPLQVFIKPKEAYHITIRSIDLGVSEDIYSYDDLENFSQIGSAFSIPKAALCLSGFAPAFSATKYKSLEEQLKAFGAGMEISLLAAIPKGSGLGTSSILAGTVLGTLSDFCHLQWDKHDICAKTLVLEQMLTSGGGWQDQFGGIFHGVKLLQSTPGILQKPQVLWAPEYLFTEGNKESILLYYTGITRVAKNILAEIVKSMFLNGKEQLDILAEMKQHALNTFSAVQYGDLQKVAEAAAYSWQLNQRLDSGTNTEETQAVFTRIKDYMTGCKLLGAGGGGYLLIFAKDINAAGKIRQLLESHPTNKRARFVDWALSRKGFQTSRS